LAEIDIYWVARGNSVGAHAAGHLQSQAAHHERAGLALASAEADRQPPSRSASKDILRYQAVRKEADNSS
jgi:hypothetical protein